MHLGPAEDVQPIGEGHSPTDPGMISVGEQTREYFRQCLSTIISEIIQGAWNMVSEG